MDTNKIITVASVAGLTVGAIGGYYFVPQEQVQVEKIVYQDKIIEVPVEHVVEVEKIINNTIEVPINVTEYVEVDNENLADVLDHIYDNDGNIEYILDDLDEDEVNQIADRVVLVNEFKTLAIKAVEEELVDELDKIEVGVVTLDEDDIERVRIDDDLDEIVIDDIDFEDKDATVIVTGTFEQDDVKYEYSVDVVFKDGTFDEIENIQVTEE